jgi:hypothetical protein
MATPPTAATQQDIQNSERLLDLSNQLVDSINERKKLLKGINAEEQQYFNTVRQQQKLSQDIAANAEKYLGYQIKSKDLAKQITATKDNQGKTELAFNTKINNQASLAEKLEKQRQEALQKAFNVKKQIQQQTNLINKLDEKNQELQIRKAEAERENNRNLVRNIQAQIRENQRLADNKEKYIKTLETQFDKEKNIAKTARETIENGKKLLEAQKKEIEFLEKNLKIRKQIEKSTGLLGGMAKAASKIPGIGQYLNADEAIDEMEKYAASIEEAGGKATSFGNRMLIAKKGLSVLAKGAIENLKSPEAVFTFIITKALEANRQVVELGKSLGVSADVAENLRQEYAGFARSTGDTFVNTNRLLKAQSELSKELGIAVRFSNEELVTFAKLTELTGLSAQEAGNLAKASAAAGMPTERYTDSLREAAFFAQQATGTHFSSKEVLQDISKLSAGILVKFQGNPKALGQTVVEAKKLGLTLDQIDKVGESLLNFEQSIENELKAELITGKQLNLERARAAALSGDQLALTREISSQVGTLNDFQNMNVIAQKSLADAFGLSREEMAEMLIKQEAINKYGDEAAKLNKEQLEDMKRQGLSASEYLKKQEQQRTAQDKFQDAMIKLQDIIGNLVAGPVGQLLDALADIVTVAVNILSVFSPIFSLVSGIAELISDILSEWYILYPLIGIVALGYLPKMLSAFNGIGASIKGIISNLSKGGLASLFGGGATKNASTITTSSGITLTKKAAATGPGNLTSTASATAGNAATAGGKAGAGGPKAGDGIKNTLKGISAGIQSFSKVSPADIAKLAGSAVALVLLTPAIPALLALQFINGKLIQSALTGIGKGLSAIGTALSNPKLFLGLAAFTGVMIGLGFALKLAAPAITAIGGAISSVITSIAGGIATIVGSIGDMISKLGEAGPALLLLGPALFGIAGGLAAMGFSGLLALPSIIALTALGAVAPSLSSIGIGGEGGKKGGKEEINNGIDLTPMIAAINEVKAAIDRLYNKDTSINMDGKKVGTTLVQGSYKVA